VPPAGTPLDVVVPHGGVTIHGHIADAQDVAIAGALVIAMPDVETGRDVDLTRAFVAVADGDGRYRLGLGDGRHVYVVRANGYAQRSGMFTAEIDQQHDFHLAPAGEVAGRTVMASTREPVRGATIELRPLTPSAAIAVGQTDEKGEFVVRSVAPGRYHVAARTGSLLETSAPLIEVRELERIEGLLLQMERGRVIAGRAIAQDGSPAALVDLDLVWPDAAWRTRPEWRTDDTGRFRIEGLRPRPYTVRVHQGTGHLVGATLVDVSSQDVNEVVLAVRPEATR
jgi:hypothetical protein